MSYEKNYTLASQAYRYVRSKVSMGAINKVSDLFTSNMVHLSVCKITQHYMRESVGLSNHPVPKHIRENAALAESMGCGNCGEQASVAFMYLYNKGVRPIEFMELLKGDHAFVVVGRASDTVTQLPIKWNSSTVICDPWDGKIYQAKEYDVKMLGGSASKPWLIHRSD